MVRLIFSPPGWKGGESDRPEKRGSECTSRLGSANHVAKAICEAGADGSDALRAKYSSDPDSADKRLRLTGDVPASRPCHVVITTPSRRIMEKAVRAGDEAATRVTRAKGGCNCAGALSSPRF
ncbi:Protein of unknown function [Gryllus bimaculatus]|nr:Protein of unknown function [Gryllus bimaculatus]